MLFANGPVPPRPHAIYFLASQSIVWPYWQPAGNFTCPKMGSAVVPVKFGLGSSWISTWKANGSCAAYTSPNYKDAQRVAFVPNKPPFLNNLNVPLRSRSGTAHPGLASVWLDGSPECLSVIGWDAVGVSPTARHLAVRADPRLLCFCNKRGYHGSGLNKWMNPHKNSKAWWGCAGLRPNKVLKHPQLINTSKLENQIPRHNLVPKNKHF